jgi:hypothetical protein
MSAIAAGLNLEQKEVYQMMSAAWRSQADAAIKLQAALINDVIWKKFKLGQIVRDMKQNEARYGESAVEQLAVVLGSPATELWEAQRLATCYTEETLQKLIDRAAKTGRRIQWSHLRQLADMSESAGAGAAKTRRELETQIINEGLTARELTQIIQQRLGARSLGSGRTPAPPRTPAAGLQQIREFSNGFVRRWEGYAEHVFKALDTAGEDQLSEQTMQHLEESKEAQLKLQETLTQSLNRTNAAISRVDRVLHGTSGPKAVETKAAATEKPPAAAKKTTAKTTAKTSAAEASNRITQARTRRPTGALA